MCKKHTLDITFNINENVYFDLIIYLHFTNMINIYSINDSRSGWLLIIRLTHFYNNTLPSFLGLYLASFCWQSIQLKLITKA